MKYYRKQPVETIQWRGDNQNEVYQLASKAVEDCYTADDADSNLHVAYWDDKKRKHLAAIPKFGWVAVEGKTLQFYKDETFRKTFKAAEEEKVDAIATPEMEERLDEAYRYVLDAMFGGCEKLFGKKPNKDVVDAIKESVLHSSNKTSGIDTVDILGRMMQYGCSPSISDTLCKVRDNVEKAFNDKIREEKYKSAWEDSEGNIHYNESTPEQIKLKAMYKEFMDNYKKMLDAWIEGGIEANANELQKYAVNEKDVEFDTFDSVLDEMKELHAKKNKDYGDSFHKSFMELGPMAGIVRLNDKMERAKSLVKKGKAEVKDESLLDTLKDMSCYAVMLYVELKNKENE